jgi:glycosyltransferase involved in cell wall biosynthesis
MVTTRVGSLAEAVIDGVTGTLAPPDDLKGFVGAVERALDDMDGLAHRAQAVAVSWSDVAGALVSMAAGVSR